MPSRSFTRWNVRMGGAWTGIDIRISQSIVRSTEDMMPSVEVVFPVRNRKNLTLQCLRSLFHADLAGLDVHAIVVDGASTDGTSDSIREQFPTVELIQVDRNLWYTAGTNRGIQAALSHEPDYILTCNEDQVFHEQCLQRLIRCAEQNRTSIVGALLLDWNRPDCTMAVGARWDTWFGGWRIPQKLLVCDVPNNPWPVELIVGNCVLYPIQAIKQVGLMNEKEFPQYGDVEYTPRMRRAGWNLLIEPRAYVWCQPNAGSPSLRTLPFRQVVNLLFFDKTSAHNLIGTFRAYWLVAPSRGLGCLAFVIRVFRIAMRGLGFGGSWPHWPDGENSLLCLHEKRLDSQDFARALRSLPSLRQVAGD